jgi:tetratricopeptide (TPR) repeat protein
VGVKISQVGRRRTATTTKQASASFAHYRAAASLAQEAGDSAFHAWVLGNEALALIHLGNDREAIGVLEAAQQVAADRACPSTRGFLSSMSCHTYARLNDRHAAWKAYGTAEKLFDAEPADGVPSRLSWFHPAHILGSAGRAHLASGNPGNARRELEQALALHPPHLVREKAEFLARLAEAHLASSDLDAACTLLGDAFVIATHTGSNRIIEKIQKARGSVPRKYAADRPVRELDELLATAPPTV